MGRRESSAGGNLDVNAHGGVVSQLPGMIWTTDRELRIQHLAGWAVQQTRIRPVVGMSLYEFLGTDDPTDPAIAHHLAALAGHGQTFRYEYEGRWYAAFIHPLRDDEGQVIGCLGAAFDITGRRAIEQELERGEARLAEAQRVAHIGSFEWEVASNVVSWSAELQRIHGLEPGTFRGSYEDFMRFVHPDDVDYTNRIIFEAFRMASEFEYEHRIVRHDGSVRVLHSRGRVFCDESGKPVRVVGSCWDVTEIREVMDALERARSLLEATIEATADGILVVDCDGKIRAKNRRFLGLWAIPDELADQNDDEKLLAYVMEQLDDPEAFLRGVRELYGNVGAQSFDVLRFKDGRVYERYSRPQQIGGEVVGRVWSFRDVTERERLLRRALFLADATRLLASLDVEPALDSVARLSVPFMGDACAIDLLGNGGPRRLLVVTRDASQVVDPELNATVMLGHATIYDIDSRSYMAVPLLAKDAVIGAMTFVAGRGRRYTGQDLELGEELARRVALSVQNAQLYEEAKAALKMRDEFLSVAAHEIRGPITSMHIAVQSLLRDGLPESARPRFLQIIEREDRRIARFVDELLDLGTIRSGRMHFTLEEVDLAEVVRDAASRLGGELARSGSALSITSQGCTTGRWDRHRLDQVATNLLSNAIKFGLGKPISATIRENGESTTLIVEDHGIGVPPDKLERIFEPFERAVSVRHYGGLGLGLYIVRTIVTGLGGTVRLESRPNSGATCTVELPRVNMA